MVFNISSKLNCLRQILELGLEKEFYDHKSLEHAEIRGKQALVQGHVTNDQEKLKVVRVGAHTGISDYYLSIFLSI